MNLFNQEKKLSNEVEEVGERRTSVLGYILLFIMVVFVIVVGQTVFSDLGDIPKRPVPISSCVSQLDFQSYDLDLEYSLDYYSRGRSSRSLSGLSYLPSSCSFGEIDHSFGLDSDFRLIESDLRQIVNLNSQISSLNNKISQGENEIDRLGNRYDISLQERMAGEQNPVMDSGALQGGIINQQSNIGSLRNQIQGLAAQRDQLVSKVSPGVNKIQSKLVQARKAYDRSVAFYNFKIFLLKLIFVIPIFIFAIFYYLRLKRKNSPYTIIYTAIVTASSLLFLQIVLVFLYEIIPRGFLAKIFKIFMSTPILRYVLYYGGVFLVLGLFGGVVYFIQKRVYNPKNVAMRRLKVNKCPGCSFVINMYYNFCPKCGRQLKEKCNSCGNLRMSDLPHCPNCGK